MALGTSGVSEAIYALAGHLLALARFLARSRSEGQQRWLRLLSHYLLLRPVLVYLAQCR